MVKYISTWIIELSCGKFSICRFNGERSFAAASEFSFINFIFHYSRIVHYPLLIYNYCVFYAPPRQLQFKFYGQPENTDNDVLYTSSTS